MKRLILIFLSAVMLAAALSACAPKTEKAAKKEEKAESVLMPTVINTVEYTLYQNIFYNEKASEYSGQAAEKEGTFATLYDAYNDVTRYYVWGYNDNTKCCDWQWELKYEGEEKDLPKNGSLITVSGTYESDKAALDGFWIVNPEITIKTKYKGNDCDIDMLSMSNTLERVQITNVKDFPDKFSGKSIGFYGRMKNDAAIEDPYYDNSWNIPVEGEFEVPAFGTIVIANGRIEDGKISGVTLSKNTQY